MDNKVYTREDIVQLLILLNFEYEKNDIHHIHFHKKLNFQVYYRYDTTLYVDDIIFFKYASENVFGYDIQNAMLYLKKKYKKEIRQSKIKHLLDA